MNQFRISIALAPLALFPLAVFAGCSESTSTPNTPTTADAGASDSGTHPTTGDAGPGDAGPTTFVPSNFDPTTLDMSLATDVDVAGDNGGCTLDTDNPQTFSCNNQEKPFGIAIQQVAQPNGAPTLLVVGVRSFRVGAGVTLDIAGTHPLAIYSLGPVDVAGTIHAAASGSTEGNGALHKGGLGEPESVPDESGLGGAGASFCGKGGDGAPTAGDAGADAGSGTTAVASYGSPELIPLYGGSSGANHASSGYGGGAVQITSLVSISVSGAINVNGDGGNQVFGSTENGSKSGGGGGSGGAILLEAPTVTGGGKLFANGGGGASGDDSGGDGQESSIAAPGASPSGGAGSAGAMVDGAKGSSIAKSGGVTDNGGGGGGAGYIRINTESGVAGFNGAASPNLSSTCGTQGKLRH